MSLAAAATSQGAGVKGRAHAAIFHRAVLREKVKILPREIGSNVRDIILAKLQSKLEGACSRHGFVRPGSVRIQDLSDGRIEGASLNGDVVYQVSASAEVCNPAQGHIVPARIVNSNKFGLLAHSGIEVNGRYLNILEIVITRHNFYGGSAQQEVPVDTVRVGDDVFVEVIGKTFELGDNKISIAGRLLRVAAVSGSSKRLLLPTGVVSAGDGDDDGGLIYADADEEDAPDVVEGEDGALSEGEEEDGDESAGDGTSGGESSADEDAADEDGLDPEDAADEDLDSAAGFDDDFDPKNDDHV